MPDIDFGREIGPLPLGAWVAVVGGGLGIAWWSRRNQTTGEPVIVEDTSGVPGVGAGFDAYVPAVNVGVTNPTAPTIATNEEWGRAAVNYLIAQGYDGVLADSAIRKYLATEPGITAQEFALIRIAILHLGSVPELLPPPLEQPPVVTPTPVPVPVPGPAPAPPAPVAPRIFLHRVGPGQSLWWIAKHYYGDGNRWRELYAANRKGITRPDGSPGYISNPDYLRPGDWVYVPGIDPATWEGGRWA